MGNAAMVSRQYFLHDPDYEQQFLKTFSSPPAKPTMELYLPAEFLTPEISLAIMGPVWKMEITQVWPAVAKRLASEGVKGDLLEFGVYAGTSFSNLLKIFRDTGVIRKFYGFDSFEGLPAPDSEKDQATFRQGQYRSSRTQAEATIAAAADGTENIELVEGWFSDTLPQYANIVKEVAFCRIDCDLYSSTVDCLNFLKGRLVDRAVLYFDDWTYDVAKGETRAFFEFAKATKYLYGFTVLYTSSCSAMAIQVSCL